jgi:hypothetical protein
MAKGSYRSVKNKKLHICQVLQAWTTQKLLTRFNTQIFGKTAK